MIDIPNKDQGSIPAINNIRRRLKDGVFIGIPAYCDYPLNFFTIK